jgi:hypothetical protein
MRFYKSSIFVLAAAIAASTTAITTAQAFSIKEQVYAPEEGNEVSNRKFEQAALLEARAYICGTDEPSEAAMRAGMQETGVPEDTAIEIVSDLASGIIDKAEASGSKEICGKARVQLSFY